MLVLFVFNMLTPAANNVEIIVIVAHNIVADTKTCDINIADNHICFNIKSNHYFTKILEKMCLNHL